MYTKQMIAALAALSSVATAAPATTRNTGGAFSVSQVEVGKKTRNGPAAYAAALSKFGAPVPQEVQTGMVDAAAQGSVTASPEQYDSEYLCDVGVGSQTLKLDFDTGSSDLWVFSTELPSSDDGSHTLYSCTGTKKSGYTWSISYGDGSGASGNVFADKVTVGGVTATSQAVEAATSISSEFVQGAGDGLLGLAFSSINTVKPQSQTTFFDTVKAQLASPLFAVTLKHAAPGSYDFGYIDTSKYTGSLAYASVDSSQGFWSFNTGGYSVGNTTSTAGFSAIADTGTSLMLLPDAVAAAYYKQVPGSAKASAGYTVPCSATLPSFSINISGYKATVPGAYMNYAPNGGSSCYGGIQSNSGIGFSILGDVFLKSQYVIFDSNGPRLGFAKQA